MAICSTDLLQTPQEVMSPPFANFAGRDLRTIDLAACDVTGGNFRRANLAGIDLSDRDLSKCDFSGANLSGCNLSRTILDGARMVATQLVGSCLECVSLRDAVLYKADLSGAKCEANDFERADLRKTNWTGAQLLGACLERGRLSFACFASTNLSEACLIEADLYRADFSHANMTDADCSGAELEDTILYETVLERTVLQGANLVGSEMSHVRLHYTDLQDANLAYVHLWETDLRGAYLQGANFSRVEFSQYDLSRCDFTNARLYGAWFQEAQLIECNFSEADLEEAVFKGADCTEAIFGDANLSGANFSGATCERADFRGAKFGGTTFSQANLRHSLFAGTDACGADLSDADVSMAFLSHASLRNLYGADLTQADLSETDLEGADIRSAILRGATLVKATLCRADLEDADCSCADFTQADLSQLNAVDTLFDQACLHSVKLNEANFAGARLKQADLRGEVLPCVPFDEDQLDEALLDVEAMSYLLLSWLEEDSPLARKIWEISPYTLPLWWWQSDVRASLGADYYTGDTLRELHAAGLSIQRFLYHSLPCVLHLHLTRRQVGRVLSHYGDVSWGERISFTDLAALLLDLESCALPGGVERCKSLAAIAWAIRHEGVLRRVRYLHTPEGLVRAYIPWESLDLVCDEVIPFPSTSVNTVFRTFECVEEDSKLATLLLARSEAITLPRPRFADAPELGIVQIVTSKQLHQEGNTMGHCAGTYVERCARGYCFIYHVESPAGGSTLQLDSHARIVQHRGTDDLDPPAGHTEIVERWLAERVWPEIADKAQETCVPANK